ncbi:hypothetical protein D9M70_511260 [compost metagenome]
MLNQALRIAGRPKWPMSAYRASAPVNASTTAPSSTKLIQGNSMMKRSPHMGFSAASTSGVCQICQPPSAASVSNQSSITGPKSLPMAPVPCDWITNSATSTTSAIGTTQLSSWCDTMPIPSSADSTEIAGVIMLSP